ncbi:RNA-binding protein [Streptomyces sp. NPDC056192]|uniref:RNA-binding protein n=1 Tax=Streptomyces sp. NPDC056192 TaxID=3345743 RepID=UPI0035E1E93A
MPPSFVHRITKYDPADRDEHGHYAGAEEAVSDHGLVEAAYLAAIAAFAEASGIDRLEIREPAVTGFVHFGVEPSDGRHGLGGLFPPDLSGYHDGAEVSLPVALELVRGMLRDQGAWCRLEAGDVFTVHVGWDQYVYVGSDRLCADAVARTRELGLFPEPMATSPYAAELEEPDVTEAANEGFWARVRTVLASQKAVLLEEGYVRNAARFRRLTPQNLDAVRTGLGLHHRQRGDEHQSRIAQRCRSPATPECGGRGRPATSRTADVPRGRRLADGEAHFVLDAAGPGGGHVPACDARRLLPCPGDDRS